MSRLRTLREGVPKDLDFVDLESVIGERRTKFDRSNVLHEVARKYSYVGGHDSVPLCAKSSPIDKRLIERERSAARAVNEILNSIE